jgi:hypothetical protein
MMGSSMVRAAANRPSPGVRGYQPEAVDKARRGQPPSHKQVGWYGGTSARARHLTSTSVLIVLLTDAALWDYPFSLPQAELPQPRPVASLAAVEALLDV